MPYKFFINTQQICKVNLNELFSVINFNTDIFVYLVKFKYLNILNTRNGKLIKIKI